MMSKLAKNIYHAFKLVRENDMELFKQILNKNCYVHVASNKNKRKVTQLTQAHRFAVRITKQCDMSQISTICAWFDQLNYIDKDLVDQIRVQFHQKMMEKVGKQNVDQQAAEQRYQELSKQQVTIVDNRALEVQKGSSDGKNNGTTEQKNSNLANATTNLSLIDFDQHNRSQPDLVRWTEAENQLLLGSVKKFTQNNSILWWLVEQELPLRTGNQIKQQYRKLLKLLNPQKPDMQPIILPATVFITRNNSDFQYSGDITVFDRIKKDARPTVKNQLVLKDMWSEAEREMLLYEVKKNTFKNKILWQYVLEAFPYKKLEQVKQYYMFIQSPDKNVKYIDQAEQNAPNEQNSVVEKQRESSKVLSNKNTFFGFDRFLAEYKLEENLILQCQKHEWTESEKQKLITATQTKRTRFNINWRAVHTEFFPSVKIVELKEYYAKQILPMINSEERRLKRTPVKNYPQKTDNGTIDKTGDGQGMSQQLESQALTENSEMLAILRQMLNKKDDE